MGHRGLRHLLTLTSVDRSGSVSQGASFPRAAPPCAIKIDRTSLCSLPSENVTFYSEENKSVPRFDRVVGFELNGTLIVMVTTYLIHLSIHSCVHFFLRA